MISTGSPVSRVFASTREQRLTASPMTLKESRPAPPIDPATTVPELTPTPISQAAGPAAVDGARDLDRALHGAVGVVGERSGAPQTASRPSPTNWSTWPRWRRDDRDDHLEQLVQPATTSEAEALGRVPGEVLTSQNSSETSTSWPSGS